MPVPDDAPVREGEVLDNKYRVDRVLGVGGMGVVVAATHVQLQTRVALKFLLPEVLKDPQVVERFTREARAAVQIQSEHVARVTDVGALPNGAPYMVMEYLEGQDLAQALAGGSPLPLAQIVGYILEACEAIAEAHALGIVHRDLKPANLFLARRTGCEAVVKVLDFGISKTRDAVASGLTQTSAMMGSPYYMSPEQMKCSRDVDARSDIWSLGTILYELLAGVPPFRGETITEIVYLVTQSDPPALRDLRPEVPDALAEVIKRCLQRDPALRYANIAEFTKALVPFGPPRSDISYERICRILGRARTNPPLAPSPSIETKADTGAALPQDTASAWAYSQKQIGAKRKLPLVIAIAAVVGLSLIGFTWRMLTVPRGSASAGLPHVRPAQSQLVPAPAQPITPALPKPPEPSSSVVSVPAAADSKSVSATVPSATVEAKPPTKTTTVARSPKRAAAAVRKREAPPSPAPVSRRLNMGMKE